MLIILDQEFNLSYSNPTFRRVFREEIESVLIQASHLSSEKNDKQQSGLSKDRWMPLCLKRIFS